MGQFLGGIYYINCAFLKLDCIRTSQHSGRNQFACQVDATVVVNTDLCDDKTGLVYGMGHAVYTKSDPRAIILKTKAKELADVKGRSDEYTLYGNVEKLTPKLFQHIKKSGKVVSPNVDFYSGFVYDLLGFPREIYTPIFAMSRVVGWCAHRMEELINGKRIIRPAYKNVESSHEYIPMNKRQ